MNGNVAHDELDRQSAKARSYVLEPGSEKALNS